MIRYRILVEHIGEICCHHLHDTWKMESICSGNFVVI